MSRTTRAIEFNIDDRTEVVDVMRQLADARHGWVNIQPIVEAERLPPPPAGFFSGWLTGGLPPLPIATWMAPQEKRGALRPGSAGLAHNANAKVARRLVAAGIVTPPGWRAVQDNARRGVVLEVPADTDPEAVLDWLLRAMEHLSDIDCFGDYRATVHV